MKHSVIILLQALMVSACTGFSIYSGQANIEIVEKYQEAVINKDYDTMKSLLAENYVGYGPSVTDSTNKIHAITNWKWNNENLYESIDFNFSQMLPASIHEGAAEGDWVSNWAYVTIMYKDGRGPVSLWVNVVYQIDNGQIVRSRTFYNETDVMAQLGYRIFPPLTVPQHTVISN